MIDHRRETSRGNIAFGMTVNGVAHRHVIGGNRLGHEARGAGGAEEAVRRFLARTDLGEGAVNQRIEVQLLGFVVGARGRHGMSSTQPLATMRSISTWLADLALAGNFKDTVNKTSASSGSKPSCLFTAPVVSA